MNIVKKFSRFEKYTKYSIYIIIFFSIIVLSLTSIYHVSGDGCWYIPVGKFIATNYKIPLLEPLGRDEPFWSPPLYHIIVAFVYYFFGLFGNNIANFAVKFVSPVFGILSLIFSFIVIKKLVNPKIAFYSIIFLAFIPIFMDYSILSYVESALVFFTVLSVYFLIKGKFALAGAAAGLSILTKYNGVFILPVLVYILYQRFDKKTFLRNALLITILPLLIALPWFIRNWVMLGNPVWPFLNFIFGGFQPKSYAALDLSRLVHYNLLLFTYLGIFGIPDGNYSAFSFLDIPYFGLLLTVWLIGTLIFIIPLFLGCFTKTTKNHKGIAVVWIVSYLILFILYVINVGWAVSRMILPAFPAMAVFWAFGFDMLNSKFGKIAPIFVVLVIAGFIAADGIKISIAANAWDFYEKDFEWAMLNTEQDAVFLANGQCVPYNLERKSLFATDRNLGSADYIWINQNFRLDIRSILDEETLKSIRSKNYKITYSNKETGTIIYATQ